MPTSGEQVQRRPRVALVASEVDDRWAVGSVLAELVRCAHDRVDFVVVSQRLAEELRPLVRWQRVRVPAGLPKRLRVSLFFVLAGLRLLRVRADLVHAAGSYPLVPNRVDLASVHFCHAAFDASGVAGGSPLIRALAVALERRCYRRARCLAALSRRGKRELELHFPGTRVVVTPNGVDGERFRPDPVSRHVLRRLEGVRDDEVVCLFVGRAWERKGLELAIEGLARAGGGLRLWVVGSGDRERYLALAERLGVSDRVRFFGERRDTPRFYQAADVFVLPTAWEGFSLAALEAAAAGLPLVATAANGIDELVADGEAGFLVVRDAGAVARALAALSSDPARRARMGLAARLRSREYTWERSVESVVGVYRELCDTVPHASAEPCRA